MARKRAKKKGAERGITAIRVRGFKSIYGEQEIEIRPLTVLAGANSAGKSSMIQPLLLLKQTLDATYDPGPLLLDGPNVRFSTARQLLSHISGREDASGFSISLSSPDHSRTELLFTRPDEGTLDIAEMRFWSHGSATEPSTLRPSMSHDEILEQVSWAKRLFQAFRETFKNPDAETAVLVDRCFLAVAIRDGTSELHRSGIGSTTSDLIDDIRSVIHLPGLRGNPERTYRISSTGPVFPGVFQDYAAGILSHWKSTRSPRLRALGDALKTLELTWKVDAVRVDDTKVEVRVGRMVKSVRGGPRDLVNIADAGFGLSQTLPVAVALLTAGEGQLVYLEQPEIHLHPRAQRQMAELLKDAAERGVRVVVETHSALLLLGIRTLVAEGRLDPALVKLHWFTRQPDGATTIDSTDLDEDGAFGDWPQDFGAVEMEAEDSYLEAVGL